MKFAMVRGLRFDSLTLLQSRLGRIYRLLVNLKDIVNLRLTRPLSTILLVFKNRAEKGEKR
jgi:hypothetical protein